MKRLATIITSILTALALSIPAFGDATYPWTSPVYIPTAVSPPASFSAPGDYVFTTGNISTAIVQVSGTCTGFTAAVQGSPQVGTSVSWTTLPAIPATGGASVTSLTSTGIWKVDTSGFAQTRLHITALTAACSISMSGTPASSAILSASSAASVSGGDPCASPGIVKSSVALSQASSTTAAIVAASAGKKTYVCGFTASAVGTTPTFTFVTGTQTTTPCDTGPSNLSGAINPSATVGVMSYGPSHTAFSTAASGQLCLTTAATTDVAGVLTYVQQ